jgi:hypothetical protein
VAEESECLRMLTSLANVAAIKSGSAAPQEKKEAMMPRFRAPMINLYSRDLSRAAAFYSGLEFSEGFRTPESGRTGPYRTHEGWVHARHRDT